MKTELKPMTSMRIDPVNLDFLASYKKRGMSYDDVLGMLLKFIEKQPDFKKELILA